jgi:5-oxoprolinase (ATP-hydrolysing) subunit A
MNKKLNGVNIDLNCDMGESYGVWKMGADEAIMPFISSANIACGFHAGDPATIRKTVQLAVAHGVAIGAHPSLPDLMGFGRRVMKISPQDMYDLVLYQAGALQAFARAAGTRLHHVKCHGALYNMSADDVELSQAMAQAVKDLGDDVMLYGLSNSPMLEVARQAGLRVAGEVFADRAYTDAGRLSARELPGAMIVDETQAVAQALQMIEAGFVTSLNGKMVPVAPQTLCLHGDQAAAMPFAKALRAAFAERGIVVRAG